MFSSRAHAAFLAGILALSMVLVVPQAIAGQDKGEPSLNRTESTWGHHLETWLGSLELILERLWGEDEATEEDSQRDPEDPQEEQESGGFGATIDPAS